MRLDAYLAFFTILYNLFSAFAENVTVTTPSPVTGFSKCASSDQCNLSEGFTCKDGLCKCAYDTLKFNPESKKCMAHVGGQCGFFIGSSNATMAQCPDNAMCVFWNSEAFKANYQYVEKHCVCMSGHYKDEAGNCVPFAKFAEDCDDKRKCDVESDLVCSLATSKCECPFGGDQYYDTELRKCISFVGGNCTMYCVSDAFCENYNPEIHGNPKRWTVPETSRNFETETICQCRPGYEPTADRRCKLIPPGYNSPCYGDDEQCDTKRNLRCIDKICQCNNPLHQTYSYEFGRCLGSVGDTCDPHLEEACVPHAKCSFNESTGYNQCSCQDGYSSTPARKCMKSYGQECFNEFCNVFSGLACINRTCQCYDSFLKYDDSVSACVSSVGAPCGKVYLPLELDEFALNGHIQSMRQPFVSNDFRNQYMNMKSMCMECDGYHISCPEGSSCVSDTDILVVVRGKERRRCKIAAT